MLSLSIFLTACTDTPDYSMDSARQIAVDRIMTDDNYVQNDGYDLREIEAKTLDCINCHAFTYEYMIISEQSSFNAFSVNVIVEDGEVISTMFSPIIRQNTITPIVDRFDEFCDNKCGDGICDDIVCQGSGCTCEENIQNCPEDC